MIAVSSVQDEICEDLCAVSVQASMQEYNVTDVSVEITPENTTAAVWTHMWRRMVLLLYKFISAIFQ